MTGIAELALGAAPIAGGAMLGTLTGRFKGPDFRALLKSDIELLDSLPEDSFELRAALRASIEARVYELIASVERTRELPGELRRATSGYQGNWRDIFVFICAVLFTVVWWNVPHSRSNWLITFIILLILSAVIGVYVGRWVFGLLREAIRPD